MSKASTAFLGSYESVGAAATDFDAVTALHHSGGVGHVEAAVVSRGGDGRLSWDRHERLGGVHLSHHPSDEMHRLSDQLDTSAAMLAVIGSGEDTAAVQAAATGASNPHIQTIEHLSLSEGFLASGDGGGTPVEDTGFEEGEVGRLGV